LKVLLFHTFVFLSLSVNFPGDGDWIDSTSLVASEVAHHCCHVSSISFTKARSSWWTQMDDVCWHCQQKHKVTDYIARPICSTLWLVVIVVVQSLIAWILMQHSSWTPSST